MQNVTFGWMEVHIIIGEACQRPNNLFYWKVVGLGSYDDGNDTATSTADVLHDPLTYIELAIGIRGAIKATANVIAWFAEISTIQPGSSTVVIGLWLDGAGYTKMGEALKASYLDMNVKLYAYVNKIPGLFWQVNKQFLVNAVKAGKIFILQTPFKEARKLN